jgi:adhesin/invasin
VSPILTPRRTCARALLCALFVAGVLAAASPVGAQCAGPPVRASIKFDASMPADVTFRAAPSPTPIKLIVQVENCSGGPLLTTTGFSSSDFFRRLYFTDPRGGTVINKSEETLHGYSPPLFCLSRSGVLQSPAIPVFPVEVLPGPQGEPAVPKYFREYVIDDVRTLYDLTFPGHYSVKAVIPLVTFGGGALIADCDQFEGTVANVTAQAGRQAFTVESNTLELVILGPPAADNSSIEGTGPVIANGTAASTVTIVLKDAAGEPVPNVTPAFSATGSGNTIGACSATNASGEAACSLRSTTAEVKTLSITSPIAKTGGTVTFIAGTPSAGTSTIAGTGPVVADGSAASTVTITLNTATGTPTPGFTPTFSATGSGNSLGACSPGDDAGVSTCTLKSTKAEVKTLAITSPITKTGGTVSFVAGPPSAASSTIAGTSPVIADGIAASTVTITLRDLLHNGISGVTPTFSATGSNNTLGACTATNASGVSTCTLRSTKAEAKTLAMTTPIAVSGASVTFNPGPVDHLVISPPSSSIAVGGSQFYTAEAFDAADNSRGDVTAATTFTMTPSGSGTCTASTCTATSAGMRTVTGTHAGKTGQASLTVGAPGNLVRVWVGLTNSDDVGIKFDLEARVTKGGAVASGRLGGVAGGSSAFNNALLYAIPLSGAAITGLSPGDSLEVLVRNACSGSGKSSGRARLWFNGAKIDTGPARDAGSRLDAASGGSTIDFLRSGLALGAVGSARTSIDKAVGARCGPFQSFGTFVK